MRPLALASAMNSPIFANCSGVGGTRRVSGSSLDRHRNFISVSFAGAVHPALYNHVESRAHDFDTSSSGCQRLHTFAMRFRTTILSSGKTAAGIEVPPEVVEAL